MATPKTVAVSLNGKSTTYHGLYRVKVELLPRVAFANVVLAVVFGGLFAAAWFAPWPFWAQLLTGVWTTQYVLGLVASVIRILVQSSK